MVQISCELTIAGQTLHAETKNLSTGGAAIRFVQPLTVGEVVTVGFFLTQDGIEDPDHPQFECAASIRWSKPAGEHAHENFAESHELFAETLFVLASGYALAAVNHHCWRMDHTLRRRLTFVTPRAPYPGRRAREDARSGDKSRAV